MKSIRQVTRRALLQSSILVLALVVLFTNLGFTWLFKNYVSQLRANEIQLIIKVVQETFKDGVLTAEERTLLRQTANQSSLHLLVRDNMGADIFDSTIGGNGAKRQLLSRQKEVLDLEQLKYKTFKQSIPSGEDLTVLVGQQSGWAFSQEDLGFVIGVNLAFLAVTLIALPLVWGVSKWLSIKLSRPIIDIQRATEVIKNGDYHEVKLDDCETLELQALSEAVTALAYQLGYQDALRRRLTTDIAHELRSPLAVLKSQLEGIQDGVLQPDEARLNRLSDEVNRLTQLIDDMNELTTVENELYKLELLAVDLSELVEVLLEDFRLVYNAKQLELIGEVQPGVTIMADPGRLRQVLVNLLTNAYKYTEIGSVTVKLHEADNRVVIEIEDTGVGIAEEDLPFVFQRFYRADPSRSRNTGGAGIGLTIAERLVKVHGGHIEINSKLNVGTSMRVYLPRN